VRFSVTYPKQTSGAASNVVRPSWADEIPYASVYGNWASSYARHRGFSGYAWQSWLYGAVRKAMAGMLNASGRKIHCYVDKK